MTRTPSPLLEPNEKTKRDAPTLSSDTEREKKRDERKNARRSFRRARRRRRCALVSFASLFVVCVSFVFSRELEMPKRCCVLVFFELLFSLEKEREKTVPTREIYACALGRRERDATKTRAKKRRGRVAYLFFRTNSMCAKGVFVRVFAHQSRRVAESARASGTKLCVEIVSP